MKLTEGLLHPEMETFAQTRRTIDRLRSTHEISKAETRLGECFYIPVSTQQELFRGLGVNELMRRRIRPAKRIQDNPPIIQESFGDWTREFTQRSFTLQGRPLISTLSLSNRRTRELLQVKVSDVDKVPFRIELTHDNPSKERLQPFVAFIDLHTERREYYRLSTPDRNITYACLVNKVTGEKEIAQYRPSIDMEEAKRKHDEMQAILYKKWEHLVPVGQR